MIFQILDANYSYDKDGNPLVQLFGLDQNGASVNCRVAGFRPYFYAGLEANRLEEASIALRDLGLEVEVVERFEPIGYQKTPRKMLKITTKDPKEVRSLRERVKEVPGIRAVYETDILFKNRFLIDCNLGGMSWVNVPLPDWARGEHAPLVPVEEIAPAPNDENAPLHYLAFDIECLPDHGEMPRPEVSPVILISMSFEPEYKGHKDLVLVGKAVDCPRKDVQICESEREMLNAFSAIVRDFDPDIVAGYNSNDFDIPYLMERARQLHAELRVGRDGSSCYVRKIGNTSNVSITGRVVVDLLPIIRSSFSLKQYTLRNAAAELLKMEKYDVDPKEIETLWAEEGEGLRRFVSYARRDSVLAMHLLLDLRLMDKYVALARASGSLLQDIVNGGQSGMVENLLLRRFGEQKRVVPPKPDAGISEERHIENEDLKGGAVLSPEKGLQENILILDYKSLYPTIMMAHNLCYTTVVRSEAPDGDCTITAPSGGRFVSTEVFPGIMPGVLRELLEERTRTKRLMKQAGDKERRFLDAKQYAMKILLNSFYGYSGYARARLYSLALANAVTSFGRENIVRTKKVIDDIGSVYVLDGRMLSKDEAWKMGAGAAAARSAGSARRFDLSVVYGDTDSVFVRLGCEGEVTLQEAELIGRKIAETVTSNLPEPMELVFEAFARRAIFLAKKRYALWVFEPAGPEWKERIKVRGMETVRRDWCDLTSKTLKRCLELVLKEGRVDEAAEHVRLVIERLKNLDLDQDPEILADVTLTRRYTKNVGSYKNKQPHIQLVEKIKKRGGQVPGVGDRVPFVIIRGRNTRRNKELFVDRAEDPQYVLEHKIPLDTEYYIEKQILPPMLRIFEPFDIKRDRLCRGTRQCNLLGFDEAAKPQKQKSLFDF
ncbi:MAG: DNA polymerase elongation subunit [Methanotrichaceae archaeon]|nr:DNA polymerase elongation subunit [Methanotrichaceae archaeon]